MTRPSDSAIRPGLLAACTQPAMAGHLGGLSLKQLSQAVRISPRMLIYHFGSAEALVSETLIGVQQLMRAKLHSSLVQDQSRDTRKALRAMWDHCTSWEMLPFFRTYNFFISESLGLPGRNADFIEFSIDGMRNWIKTCLAYHQPGATAPKIQHFFIETFPDVSDQMSQSAHEEWAKVVSGLNTPSDTLPITYRGGTYNLQGTGIRNMLNLIAHLLPDPGLARVWPTGSAAWHEVAAGKLDRLCTLVSTPGRVFTWEVSGRRAIPGEFVTISFRINDIPTFVWDFADGHFAILPIRGGQNAQCLKEAKALPGVNEWVQGWLRKDQSLALYQPYLFQLGLTPELPLDRPAEAFFRELRNPDQVWYGLRAILASGFEALIPTFHLVVARTLPWDLYPMVKLSREVEGKGMFLPIPALLRRTPEELSAMLGQSFSVDKTNQGYLTITGMLLDHGANPNSLNYGSNLVAMAAGYRPWALGPLLAAGGDPNARDRAGVPALIEAVKAKNGDSVQRLFNAGANPLIKDPWGRTALDLARANGDSCVGLIEAALKRQAETEIRAPPKALVSP